MLRDHPGVPSVSDFQERRALAIQRKFQPWPSFLCYEDDDDFFAWYSGECVPSPDEIILREIEIIEARPEPIEISEDDDVSFNWTDSET